MLGREHLRPLQAFLSGLRAEDSGEVPDFDPAGGGAAARIFFLMEKAGPMADGSETAGRKGSGFISWDNDDPTPEAVLRFMQMAGIDRSLTLIWNIVPWWNGTRRITSEELSAGLHRVLSQTFAPLLSMWTNMLWGQCDCACCCQSWSAKPFPGA